MRVMYWGLNQPNSQTIIRALPRPLNAALHIGLNKFAVFSTGIASRALGQAGGDLVSAEPTRYRPGSAFIMMSMDPELIDVADTVKQVFDQFDIGAVRADDIEHEGVITNASLTRSKRPNFFLPIYRRAPNVYYEVGYAHALKRRVILFRKTGTGMHFILRGITVQNMRIFAIYGKSSVAVLCTLRIENQKQDSLLQ